MKKLIASILGLALSLILSATALADTANLSWTFPATNTDGTTIPTTGAGSLTRTTIEYGTCTVAGTTRTFNAKIGEMFVATPASTMQVAMVVVQEYCFRGYVTNTFGQNSAVSNVAWKANPPPTPGSITLTVAQNSSAYGVQMSQQSGGRLTTYPVGTAQAGVACDCATVVVTDQHGALCRVDNTLVNYAGTVRPAVVLAQCSGVG